MSSEIDISICPTDLHCGDDLRDADLVLNAVRQFAQREYPGARISCVQIGYRQGHSWARIDGDAQRGEQFMADFWEANADNDALYEIGGRA